MRKRDHRHLAVYLMSSVKQDIPRRYRWALIYGNYEPDINYFTYMHGFTKKEKEKFHGHNFENVLPVLQRLLHKLARKSVAVTLLDYYRLGKCMHYAADIFTYPHNPEFVGSVREHCEYEEELHEHLTDYFEENDALSTMAFVPEPSDMEAEIMQMHRNYVDDLAEYGIEMDSSYILSVSLMLCAEYLAPLWQMLYGSAAQVRMNLGVV